MILICYVKVLPQLGLQMRQRVEDIQRKLREKQSPVTAGLQKTLLTLKVCIDCCLIAKKINYPNVSTDCCLTAKNINYPNVSTDCCLTAKNIN